MQLDDLQAEPEPSNPLTNGSTDDALPANLPAPSGLVELETAPRALAEQLVGIANAEAGDDAENNLRLSTNDNVEKSAEGSRVNGAGEMEVDQEQAQNQEQDSEQNQEQEPEQQPEQGRVVAEPELGVEVEIEREVSRKGISKKGAKKGKGKGKGKEKATDADGDYGDPADGDEEEGERRR